MEDSACFCIQRHRTTPVTTTNEVESSIQPAQMSFAPPPGPPPENALTYAPLQAPHLPMVRMIRSYMRRLRGPPPADIPSLYDIERKARISHLGPFAVLHDMLLHGLLTRLDAKSLTTLSTVNKAFYIYARDDTVWRSLCVRTYTIPKSASPEERKSKIDAMGMDPAEPMLSFKGTWRLTYYFPKKKLSDAEAQQLEKARSIKASTITPPFFSDFLYQKTLRNTMDLQRVFRISHLVFAFLCQL
ncbi:hypothetical protein BC829DRAFT_283366 [Chytridium lagenaria]|nr:hypothetical protein BC829DRAFT_283366 [Chytridium lagenaria]